MPLDVLVQWAHKNLNLGLRTKIAVRGAGDVELPKSKENYYL